jgi:lysophospholipase L1-like esterase
MTRVLKSDVAGVILALLVLLAFKGAHAAWPTTVGANPASARLMSTLSNRGLNKEAREALTAGYYEGLLNEGSRVSSMNRFVLDTRKPGWEDNKRPDRQQTGNFLYYELIPASTRPDYPDHRFKYNLTTNSAGLGDKEYTLEKPARTRRIALMGDSITRGQGAPFGGNYESLLEDRLNAEYAGEGVERFEILNFAVGGYHITQQLESALTKAPAYNPDVYVMALSDLSVYRRWHGHISTLTYAGIDLKYDYLRNMVQSARLTATDPIGVWDARLARFRIPTVQWVLSEVKAHAAKHNAEMMVILLPMVEDPETLAEAFLGIPDVLKQQRIPYIDLLATFAEVPNPDAYAVGTGDRHPNAEGHKLLFERLYQKAQADPTMMRILTGAPGAVADTRR